MLITAISATFHSPCRIGSLLHSVNGFMIRSFLSRKVASKVGLFWSTLKEGRLSYTHKRIEMIKA